MRGLVYALGPQLRWGPHLPEALLRLACQYALARTKSVTHAPPVQSVFSKAGGMHQTISISIPKRQGVPPVPHMSCKVNPFWQNQTSECSASSLQASLHAHFQELSEAVQRCAQ